MKLLIYSHNDRDMASTADTAWINFFKTIRVIFGAYKCHGLEYSKKTFWSSFFKRNRFVKQICKRS